jgi:hypothetical protein
VGNLANLKSVIEGDLHRTDKSAQVSAAISRAVTHYSRKSWWFQETTTELTTSASQVYYDLPVNLKDLDSLMVNISGSKHPVRAVHYSTIDAKDTGVHTGIPYEWAIYKNQFRFYPVANDEYIITLSYEAELSALDSPSASNSWTNEGSELVRHRAMWDVCNHHLKDHTNAQTAKMSEIDAYNSLMEEHSRKVSTGKIKKSGW